MAIDEGILNDEFETSAYAVGLRLGGLGSGL
jgi:hypothetical protein